VDITTIRVVRFLRGLGVFLALSVSLSALTVGRSAAETLIIKDGSEIVGMVSSITPDSLAIRTAYGMLRIPRSDLVLITFCRSASQKDGNLRPEPAKAEVGNKGGLGVSIGVSNASDYVDLYNAVVFTAKYTVAVTSDFYLEVGGSFTPTRRKTPSTHAYCEALRLAALVEKRILGFSDRVSVFAGYGIGFTSFASRSLRTQTSFTEGYGANMLVSLGSKLALEVTLRRWMVAFGESKHWVTAVSSTEVSLGVAWGG